MKINFIKILFSVTCLFIIIIFFLGLNKNNVYTTKNLVGNSIGDFQIKSFYKDEIITQEKIKKDKFTLINFWASWCGPCRDEHKQLISLKNIKQLKIFGINFKDNKNNAVKFLNDLGDPYSYIASDDKGKLSVLFGVYGIPESILLNQELVIIKKFIGPINKNDLKIIKKIINDKN